MIHVLQHPEPPEFAALVSAPGANWLALHPVRKTKEAMPPHWRKGMPQLQKAYKGICAYFCCYVKPATGGSSTDHYAAKSKQRSDTYAWANYRFACTRMNSRKRDSADVMDPFLLADGWFELYFPTMRVRASAHLLPADLKKVRATTRRLNLNSPECRSEREEAWSNYIEGAPAAQLVRYAPFIALEAVRQGFLKPADGDVTRATIRTFLDS